LVLIVTYEIIFVGAERSHRLQTKKIRQHDTVD